MSRRADRRSSRAQTAVEFAVVLPAFLLLLIGVFQAGVAFSQKLTLEQAARDGARKAVINRSAGGSTIAARATAAVRATASSLDQGALLVSVTGGDNPDDSNGTLWEQGDTVEVHAEYPWALSILGVVVANGTLDEEATLRLE